MQLRNLFSFALCATVLTLSTAVAIEDTPENRKVQADRYLKATPPEEMFADMAEQMAKGFPEDERESFKSLLTKHLDIPALSQAMKDSMVKHFTAKELKALADFYGSEVGKSAMKKFGVYMADVMPAIQGEVMKAQAKASEEQAGQDDGNDG
ncbi:MAG: DUF2059 domain-containing protein [Verrucomicrobiota bacterium]